MSGCFCRFFKRKTKKKHETSKRSSKKFAFLVGVEWVIIFHGYDDDDDDVDIFVDGIWCIIFWVSLWARRVLASDCFISWAMTL